LPSVVYQFPNPHHIGKNKNKNKTLPGTDAVHLFRPSSSHPKSIFSMSQEEVPEQSTVMDSYGIYSECTRKREIMRVRKGSFFEIAET
jgi:hypothetical protein